jgi:hypothetical protein
MTALTDRLLKFAHAGEVGVAISLGDAVADRVERNFSSFIATIRGTP